MSSLANDPATLKSWTKEQAIQIIYDSNYPDQFATIANYWATATTIRESFAADAKDKYFKENEDIYMYKCEDYCNYFYGEVATHTGVAKVFEIKNMISIEFEKREKIIDKIISHMIEFCKKNNIYEYYRFVYIIAN